MHKAIIQNLLPEHISDLRGSGLSDSTVEMMGVYSVMGSELERRLNRKMPEVVSGLVIPYPGVSFARYKLFPPFVGKDGHAVRYLQHSGSGVHLYILPSVREHFSNPTIPLFYTEGEKKAAKATESGFPTIGLGGLWNWVRKGTARAIAELDEIVHQGRSETIVPDSDAWSKPDLLNAVYAFGRELVERGAEVSVVRIPGHE